MSSQLEIERWVQLAEEDYQLARSALRRKAPLTYGATFHAQQCAEKYLKALLARHQIAFPRTHDLASLTSLCAQSGIRIQVPEDDLDRLSAYAVEARYPGLRPALEEAQEAVRIASIVRKLIRNHLRTLIQPGL